MEFSPNFIYASVSHIIISIHIEEEQEKKLHSMSAVPFHGLRDSFSRIHSTHIIVHLSLPLSRLFFIYQTRIVLILKYIQRWIEDKLWAVYYEDGIFQVNVDVFFSADRCLIEHKTHDWTESFELISNFNVWAQPEQRKERTAGEVETMRGVQF